MDGIRRFVAQNGKVPLSWAGSTSEMNYLNLGDALSPVMVALCSGRDVERIPMASKTPRIAAVGTIGHGFKDGEIYFWGTGCSGFLNAAKAEKRLEYQPPANTRIHIGATRGPLSEALLSGGAGGPQVYGDPVWLLPRFYRPNIPKRWKLGVIVHLAELTDRAYEPHINPSYRRYDIPEAESKDIRLIHTVTPINLQAMKERIDEILACERLVSTSLHGMVFAESYGIPCLYFGVRNAPSGIVTVDVSPDSDVDSRIIDLYAGLGQSRFTIYNQHRPSPTRWDDLIDAIDRIWEPKTLREDALLEAFPLPLEMVSAPEDKSIFDLPLLTKLEFQHDVRALRAHDQRHYKNAAQN